MSVRLTRHQFVCVWSGMTIGALIIQATIGGFNWSRAFEHSYFEAITLGTLWFIGRGKI
jgi:hypothetical protein